MMAGAGGESPHVALQALGSESTQDEEEPRESGTPHRPFANGSCPTVAPLLSRGFTGWKKKKTEAGVCDWPGDRWAGLSAPKEARTSLVNHCITL